MYFTLGLILLLVNADFSDSGLPLSQFFDGKFNDFTPTWYAEVGKLYFKTMVVNAFFPLFVFLLEEAWHLFKGWRDRGYSGDVYKTKKTSIHSYVDSHSGSDFPIYVKYGVNIFIIFMTLMFGIGMPLMFLVGAITFGVIWCVERVMICYVCTIPPAFGD